MTNQNYYQNRSPFSGIFALLAFILFFIFLFYIAKGIFSILTFTAIPLIILAAILDYTVITNYIKYVFELIKTKPLSGILLTAFTIFGFPLVAAFLAFRAYVSKKLKGLQQDIHEEQNTFTEFEEIKDDFLELPEIPKEHNRTNDDYKELFED